MQEKNTIKICTQLSLIFLVSTAINSFCSEPTKRFGCHNFSSVDKIANMENNSNNNLLRNLMQCMRDTRTYNEENLETAKKLNDDFVKADAEMSWTGTKYLKDVGSIWGISVALPISGLTVDLLSKTQIFRSNNDAAFAIKVGIVGTTLIYFSLFTSYVFKSKFDMRDAAENKWLTAVKIKDFADILQTKNNLTQDIQAARQNK